MRKTALFTIVLMFASLPAMAGGLNQIGGMGTGGGAMSGAYNAVADDSSMFFYNLAGMTQFDKTYADINIGAIFPSYTQETCWGTTKHSVDGDFYPMPTVGFVHPVNDDMFLGLGITTPYGLGAKFDRDISSGTYRSETLLSVTNITPAVAFKVSDTLSLGVGLNIGYGQFKCLAPFDIGGRPLPIPTDSEADGFGLGGTVSLRWEPTEKFTWGLNYMSESKVNLDGRTKILRGPLSFSDKFDSEFTFPQKLGMGVAYQATPKLLLAMDANWYGYTHAVDDLVLDFHRLPMKKARKLDWEDNYSLHAGARYKLTERVSLSGGIGYQTAAIPDETISQLTPDVTGWDVATGISYRTERFNANLHAIYGWGEKDVKPGWRIISPGKYGAESLTVGVSFGWRW